MNRRNAKVSPESKHHHHCPTEQATKVIKSSLKKIKPFLSVVELSMWSFTSHLRDTVEPYCCEKNCKKRALRKCGIQTRMDTGKEYFLLFYPNKQTEGQTENSVTAILHSFTSPANKLGTRGPQPFTSKKTRTY